jgi:hypothetical protein
MFVCAMGRRRGRHSQCSSVCDRPIQKPLSARKPRRYTMTFTQANRSLRAPAPAASGDVVAALPPPEKNR